VLTWLIGNGFGPALVSVPVNLTAEALAGTAQRWFRRFRRADDLSRLVRAATGDSISLTQAEFDAVRHLLEDQQTWTVVGRGTVDDLAMRIASCLPPRDRRTVEDSRVAAMTIARGLLEFTIAGLDPKVFQQVLLARLHRLEMDQANALDEALFGLHADLIDRLASRGEVDAERFTSVMRQLRRVLDRVPPGAAQQGQIALYLRTLIDWLNTDPWPRDRRFGGPTLSPAAIERKVRVTTMTAAVDGERAQDLDADQLADQCQRLIVLGGPGSGKTWLAKRTARRCAEHALRALAAGQTLDDVELPLYTTCSHMFAAGGDIRAAVVSSALNQLGDLGGSRLCAALNIFFTERNAPTVLIIDSLDEAHGSDERLRQADTLPWRIILTSRRSRWNHQLVIEDRNESHLVGELQPLRYPQDVEPFIQRWFEERPEWGRSLAAQIARRPSLQQAATVPLILAFYCIIGADEPLSGFRRDIYARVLNRIITGRWRHGGIRQPDNATCLRTLRVWAWSGATSDSISGVGNWADDIRSAPSGLSEPDEAALDHVATPIGPADVDTGETIRRFIHRSVREHLVAEYVAGLGAEDAAETLLPHIWYDPDWEYPAPAAIAMHQQRDQVLRNLICLAARSDHIPKDLHIIDAAWEFRRFLARLATESTETDWSPQMARLISQARVELAQAGHITDLNGAESWVTSNEQAREALLRLLDQNPGLIFPQPEKALVELASTARDRHQVLQALLTLMVTKTGWTAARLVPTVVRLASTTDDRDQIRDALIRLLTSDASYAGPLVSGLVKLAPTAEEKRQTLDVLLRILADRTRSWGDKALVDGVTQLVVTANDKRQARKTLFNLLYTDDLFQDAEALVAGLVQLAVTANNRRRALEMLLGLLGTKTDGPEHPRQIEALLSGILQLTTTAEGKRSVLDALLRLLVTKTATRNAEAQLHSGVWFDPAEGWLPIGRYRRLLSASLASEITSVAVERLVGAVVQFASAVDDKRQASEVLLELINTATGGGVAAQLVDGIMRLDPPAEVQHQVHRALIASLSGTTKALHPTEKDKGQALQVLVRLLSGETYGSVAAQLARVVVVLDPTWYGERQAYNALLGLVSSSDYSEMAKELAPKLAELNPTPEERRHGRRALLTLLADESDGDTAEQLTGGLVRLAFTAEERIQTRQGILEILATQSQTRSAEHLINGLVRLASTAEEGSQARQNILGILASSSGEMAVQLVDALIGLNPSVEENRRACNILLMLLAKRHKGSAAAELAARVVQLAAATKGDNVRNKLLVVLKIQKDENAAHWLMAGLSQFNPTLRDLSTWRSWAAQPNVDLLAAIRRNSTLAEWLIALPSLPCSDLPERP